MTNNKQVVKYVPVKQKQKQKPKSKIPRAIATTLGSAVGGTAGGFMGAPFGMIGPAAMAGAAVGRYAGNGISDIMGFGQYRIVGTKPVKNSLYTATQVPKFTGNNRGSHRVTHREFLGDVTGTAGFGITKYPINPGVSTTFPWLQLLAQGYQQYRVRGMAFFFKSTTTEFVTGASAGTVTMATEYDCNSAAYGSKFEMENSEFAGSAKPQENLIHYIECDPRQSPLERLYIRKGDTLSANANLNTYDFANFYIATVGTPVQVIGELWCAFDIEFFKPALPDNQSGGQLEYHYYGTAAAGATPTGTPSTTRGSLSVTKATNLFTWTSWPLQSWLVTISWVGTAAAIVFPTITYTAAGPTTKYEGLTQTYITSPAAGVSSTRFVIQFEIYPTSLQAPGTIGFTIGAAGTIPTSSTVDVIISETDHTTI